MVHLAKKASIIEMNKTNHFSFLVNLFDFFCVVEKDSRQT